MAWEAIFRGKRSSTIFMGMVGNSFFNLATACFTSGVACVSGIVPVLWFAHNDQFYRFLCKVFFQKFEQLRRFNRS